MRREAQVLGRQQGQRHAKGRALPVTAFNRDLAAVLPEDAPAHGQAESRTPRPGGKPWFKNLWEVFLGDPGPGIAYLDLDARRSAINAANRKPAAARHEANGIQREVQEDLLEQVAIGPDRDPRPAH